MHGAERVDLDAGCSALSHAHRWRTPGALIDLRRYQCLSCSCSILPPPSILPPTRDSSPNAGNGHHLPVRICTTGHHHHISWPWLCLRQFHQPITPSPPPLFSPVPNFPYNSRPLLFDRHPYATSSSNDRVGSSNPHQTPCGKTISLRTVIQVPYSSSQPSP